LPTGERELSSGRYSREPQLCGRHRQECGGQVFDWNDLRHFLAFARYGSLGAAARSIGVDQSTVQRRIAALEKSIARPLVERRPGGYGLTAQGELLLVDAERVGAAVDALQRRIRTLDGSGQG
jgi:molybdate transport repressor ModE-like protein